MLQHFVLPSPLESDVCRISLAFFNVDEGCLIFYRVMPACMFLLLFFLLLLMEGRMHVCFDGMLDLQDLIVAGRQLIMRKCNGRCF